MLIRMMKINHPNYVSDISQIYTSAEFICQFVCCSLIKAR